MMLVAMNLALIYTLTVDKLALILGIISEEMEQLFSIKLVVKATLVLIIMFITIQL
jgi:hypothetical protein